MGLFGNKKRALAGGICQSQRGEYVTVEGLTGECVQMERAFRQQTLDAAEAIWRQRLDLGYKLTQRDALSPTTSFYLDPYPAMAVLILHLSDRPVGDTNLAVHCARDALMRLDPEHEQSVKAADSCRELLAELG